MIVSILKDRSFFNKIKDSVDDEVKLTSVSAYELLRGAVYLKLKNGSEKELHIVLDLISNLTILPFDSKSARIASYIWGAMKSKGIEVSDADIMIASVCISNGEKLLTLDRDFERIREVRDFDIVVVDLK